MIVDAARRVALAASLGLPGAAIVFTAFRGGGGLPDTEGMLAAGAVVLLAIWVLAATDPLVGASRTLAVAAAAFGAFALWALFSVQWSQSPSRALIEFDRAFLYAAALVLFGLLPMTRARLRWMLGAVAVAALVVCGTGLASRLLPALFPDVDASARLEYPLGYSNGLGLLAALGIVAVVHLTSSEREPRSVRATGAAALPVFAVTLLLTLSRGAMVACALGLVLYVVLGRPRLVLTGLLASVPATVIALRAAAEAEALSAAEPVATVAAAQGRHVATVVAMCAVGAAVARVLLGLLDDRILRWGRARRTGPAAEFAAAAAAVVCAALVFVAAGGPGAIDRQYREFVDRPIVRVTESERDRLRDPSGSGRADFWQVALRGFESERLHGHGAGTYQLLWYRHRPYIGTLLDGHSLFLETLAELGIVGPGLLAVGLGAILVGIARRIRGLDRTLFAALFAAMAVWVAHAAIDWDWELPAVTLWVFAVGGAALATPLRLRDEPTRATRPLGHYPVRALVAAALLAAMALPLRLAASQGPLDRARSEFARGHCREAMMQARTAVDAFGVRPEPYELFGVCAAKLGDPRAGALALERAISLDPGFWQYYYDLALIRAVAGLDPVPAARRATALNPREIIASSALRAFSATKDPRQRRSYALQAHLPWELVGD